MMRTAGRARGAIAALALLAGLPAAGCRRERPNPGRTGTRMASPIRAAAPLLEAALDSLPRVREAALTPGQQRGRALYGSLCASCHGPYGHGDGARARSFPVPLPDLSRGDTARRMPDARREYHALPADTLRLATLYIASLQPFGARGNAAAGRLLYATYCVECHGVDGRGDGRLAAGLRPRPADFHNLRLAGHERLVMDRIRLGGAAHHDYMPDWGLVFTDQRLWDLVAYLAVYAEPAPGP